MANTTSVSPLKRKNKRETKKTGALKKGQQMELGEGAQSLTLGVDSRGGKGLGRRRIDLEGL